MNDQIATWKRFVLYERIIACNFLLNIVFYVLNEDYLHYLLKREISVCLFWISLGLYIGFQLCKYEIRRLLKISAISQQSK